MAIALAAVRRVRVDKRSARNFIFVYRLGVEEMCDCEKEVFISSCLVSENQSENDSNDVK